RSRAAMTAPSSRRRRASYSSGERAPVQVQRSGGDAIARPRRKKSAKRCDASALAAISSLTCSMTNGATTASASSIAPRRKGGGCQRERGERKKEKRARSGSSAPFVIVRGPLSCEAVGSLVLSAAETEHRQEDEGHQDQADGKARLLAEAL